MATWVSIALVGWLTVSLPVSVVLGAGIRRSDGRPRWHRSDEA